MYCRNIGVEYMFLTSQAKKDWLREQFELPGVMDHTPDEQNRLVARLLRATEFENFLAKKWPSEKRFGLEGCEVMIPALKHIIGEKEMLCYFFSGPGVACVLFFFILNFS